MRYPVILFDLDGTLTDPADGICESVRYALKKGGYPVGEKADYFPWIGPSLLHSFETFAGAPADEAKRLICFYRERFSTVGLFENAVYPGIPELLRDLKSAGCHLAVATGKPTVYSQRILEHFGLSQYFDCVSGISLTEAPMDKRGVITAALEALGADDKSGCVMVGDREHDAEGARLCGIDSIIVMYGYGSRQEAQAAGATRIAETVDELRAMLTE